MPTSSWRKLPRTRCMRRSKHQKAIASSSNTVRKGTARSDILGAHTCPGPVKVCRSDGTGTTQEAHHCTNKLAASTVSSVQAAAHAQTW